MNNMPPSSSKERSKSSRKNIKLNSAENARQSMNKRRHDLSAKIRKSRKSHHIQLKRFHSSSAGNAVAVPVATKNDDGSNNIAPGHKQQQQLSIEQILQQFFAVQNEETLDRFQNYLSSNVNNNNHNYGTEDEVSKLLLRDHPGKSHELMSIFQSILGKKSHHMTLQVLRILTNLAATMNQQRQDGNNNDTSSYYGPSANIISTQSWSELIICHLLSSSLLPCLHSMQHPGADKGKNEELLEIISQCCWVIGNLAGEDTSIQSSSFTTRTFMIHKSNVIGELIQVLKQSVHTISSNECETVAVKKLILAIIRNSLWALSNLARGSATSALLFLQSSGNNGLTCCDLILMLQGQEESQPIPSDSMSSQPQNDIITWSDIHVELLWMLAFLTAREDEAMNILLPIDNDPENAARVLDLLIFQFRNATETLIGSKSSAFNSQSSGITIRMIIPILRMIGNVACSVSGRYVPFLLSRSEGGTNIVDIISKWINVINQNPSHELMLIATEATWVCGALLCDAGHEQHPSTTMGCPKLVPALCNVIAPKQGTSKQATLEWKREVLSALWNTVSKPPHNCDDGNNANQDRDDTIHVRDSLLEGFC